MDNRQVGFVFKFFFVPPQIIVMLLHESQVEGVDPLHDPVDIEHPLRPIGVLDDRFKRLHPAIEKDELLIKQ
jgi:hypothetical protein